MATSTVDIITGHKQENGRLNITIPREQLTELRKCLKKSKWRFNNAQKIHWNNKINSMIGEFNRNISNQPCNENFMKKQKPILFDNSNYCIKVFVFSDIWDGLNSPRLGETERRKHLTVKRRVRPVGCHKVSKSWEFKWEEKDKKAYSIKYLKVSIIWKVGEHLSDFTTISIQESRVKGLLTSR